MSEDSIVVSLLALAFFIHLGTFVYLLHLIDHLHDKP